MFKTSHSGKACPMQKGGWLMDKPGDHCVSKTKLVARFFHQSFCSRFTLQKKSIDHPLQVQYWNQLKEIGTNHAKG